MFVKRIIILIVNRVKINKTIKKQIDHELMSFICIFWPGEQMTMCVLLQSVHSPSDMQVMFDNEARSGDWKSSPSYGYQRSLKHPVVEDPPSAVVVEVETTCLNGTLSNMAYMSGSHPSSGWTRQCRNEKVNHELVTEFIWTSILRLYSIKESGNRYHIKPYFAACRMVTHFCFENSGWLGQW